MYVYQRHLLSKGLLSGAESRRGAFGWLRRMVSSPTSSTA